MPCVNTHQWLIDSPPHLHQPINHHSSAHVRLNGQIIWFRFDQHNTRGSNQQRTCFLLKHPHESPTLHRDLVACYKQQRTYSIIYHGLCPKTNNSINPSQLIHAYLGRPLRRGEDSLSIHHEPIHSAELLEPIFLGYLSHVALVLSSSSQLTTFHPHLFIILLLISMAIYSITLLHVSGFDTTFTYGIIHIARTSWCQRGQILQRPLLIHMPTKLYETGWLTHMSQESSQVNHCGCSEIWRRQATTTW